MSISPILSVGHLYVPISVEPIEPVDQEQMGFVGFDATLDGLPSARTFERAAAAFMQRSAAFNNPSSVSTSAGANTQSVQPPSKLFEGLRSANAPKSMAMSNARF